jgi:hypothetical protein
MNATSGIITVLVAIRYVDQDGTEYNAHHRILKTREVPEVSSDKALIVNFMQEKLCSNADSGSKF